MSMPANPACFVAFLALVRRRRTTGVSDREDSCPPGSQETRRAGELFFKRHKERKERKEKKRPDLVISC
jgi:hypothetical protein